MSGRPAHDDADDDAALRRAMEAAGITPPVSIIADCKIHRFHVEGDRRGSRTGWYVLYSDPAAGAFGCWKRDIKEKWLPELPDLSEEERRRRRERITAALQAREQEDRKRRETAVAKARELFSGMDPAPDDHPYLVRKGVPAHGLRLAADGRLVVPVVGADGQVRSLQYIDAEGGKRFATDCTMVGGHLIIGMIDDVVVIAEGYATAATIYEETGLPVVVAFYADNLIPVARSLRDRHPEANIILGADDDRFTAGNPGLTKSEKAAAVVGGQVVVPAFGPDSRGTDFNDLAVEQGGEAVRKAFAAALLVADVSEPDHAELADSAEETQPTVAGAFIDWSTFWDRDHDQPEWVYEDVLARGRGHALYAAHKEGKSLLMLFIAAKLATGSEPIVVIYLDYEMGSDDLFDRLEDMGYGPDTDLSRLRYALLPTLPPLDTAAGARALTDLVDHVQGEWPEHHLVVIIDTISRAVEGEENSADTFRDFYTHTGIQLKRRGVTWARLDHGGKDPAKGLRGSSGKGDDVDLVWKLVRTENGICLHRNLSRMNWVPEKVTFGLTEEPLAYRRLTSDWPAGTIDAAALLDRLAVPLNASVKAALATLKTADEGRRKQVVTAALRWRRELGNHPGNHPSENGREPFREPPRDLAVESPGTTPGTTGNHPPSHHGNRVPSIGGNRSQTQPDCALQDPLTETPRDPLAWRREEYGGRVEGVTL